MRKNLEDLELIKFFEWISWEEKIDPRLQVIWHTANERKCSWQQGKILKQKGVRKGVLDVCVPIPNNQYCGLFIEFKQPGEEMSADQYSFSKKVQAIGHLVTIAYSGDQAIAILKSYLRPNI